MIPKAREVRLSPEDRLVLEAAVRAPTTEQRAALRARIVLLAAEGRTTRSIARELNVMPRTVSDWRIRFAEQGVAGLSDKPRPGPSPKYDARTGRRILALLDQPPPKGYGRWTGGLLARALGDVHEQQVWRFLRSQKMPPLPTSLQSLSPLAKESKPRLANLFKGPWLRLPRHPYQNLFSRFLLDLSRQVSVLSQTKGSINLSLSKQKSRREWRISLL